ncbi:MAG: hypothetical protein EP343_08405 [Deltaproteobacteria bacterium]|nr:MAG: hypothetical protein EP343_08405 [Deltaproteobacteria bacterium]
MCSAFTGNLDPEKPELEPTADVVMDGGASETPPEPPPEPPDEPPGPGQRTLHQSCQWYRNAPAERRCTPGLLCVRHGVFDAHCLQDCSQDVTTCNANKDGRTECTQVTWTHDNPRLPQMACLNVVGKEQACDLGTSVTCQRSGFNHLMCVGGKCVDATLALQAGALCGKQWNPPIECDITRGLTCSTTHLNTCQEGVKAWEGDECNTPDSALCAPGTVCVYASERPNTTRICAKTCSTQDPPETACDGRTNFVCIPTIELDGVCRQANCTSYHDCAFRQPLHECRSFKGKVEKVCAPFERGPRKLGQSCDPSFKDLALRCEEPLSCITVQDKIQWASCFPQCRFDDDCKAFSSTMTCDTFNKVCVWRCQSTADCPQGTQCSALKICASPPNTP